jgi:uncharacterized membrane protein YkvI
MTRELSQTRFGRILLPAIIFQSVVMGGAFATGREIVEYLAEFGALGIVSIIVHIVSLTVFGIIIYELSRTFNAYDYKSLVKNLIGKFWPIFEILYIILATLFISSFLSAGGIIINQFTGIPSFVASAFFVVAIGGILYFGRETIERFATVGTMLVYLVFIVMAVIILTQRWDQAVNVITTGNTAYAEDASIVSVVSSPLIFTGYSLIVFMPVLFEIDRLETRSEAVLSAILSGVLTAIPILLTYVSLMGFYPNENVMGASIPWLAMISEVGGPILIASYVIVLIITFVETGVGYVHSIVDRIDEDIESVDYALFAETNGLSAEQRGLVAAIIIFSALLLSTFGIIAIVSRGYSIMAYMFIVVFGIPLLTIGLLRIFRPSWKEELWEAA